MFHLIPWRNRETRSSLRTRPEAEPLLRLRGDFDTLWNRFFQDLSGGLRPWGEAPSFALTPGLEERENEYLFHAEMPGFDPDEIDVKVAGKTLSVRAERKEEQEGEGRSSYRYGSFQRQLTLPQGVDEAGIDARYHQGVLEIRLPKSDEARGKRIAVNTN